jgi:hypothetical protein
LGLAAFALTLTIFGVSLWAPGLTAHYELFARNQKAAVADALKALDRIEAATQRALAPYRVNYEDYSQLVLDAQAKVNDAQRTLPSGELSRAITDAMDAYKDADRIWKYKIQFNEIPLSRGYSGREIAAIIDRYRLPLTKDPNVLEPDPTDPTNRKQKPAERIHPNIAMQLIWAVAKEKLAKARALQ